MAKKPFFKSPAFKELLFQLVLHLLVFSFYSFSRRNPQIETYELAFFLNYVVATLFISYYLLPRFYYRKKYLLFFGAVALTICVVIVLEEFWLEQIYFPDTRGTRFPGIFYSLVDVLPVITILAGFKFAWDALIKQRELDQLKVAAEESELQFLKSQINPHFLFNNLNNLYSYAIENSPKTPTIILELSGVLRYMLYECKEKFVPLEKEITQLQNFTRLNQLQIEERGIVNFKAPNRSVNFKIAPLILMVFIENAFKHSQASQSENIRIDIDIQLSDSGKLDFFCTNSFQLNNNNNDLTQGIGLINARKRLQLIYPNAHELKIKELKDEYIVHLSLQLHQGYQA